MCIRIVWAIMVGLHPSQVGLIMSILVLFILSTKCKGNIMYNIYKNILLKSLELVNIFKCLKQKYWASWKALLYSCIYLNQLMGSYIKILTDFGLSNLSPRYFLKDQTAFYAGWCLKMSPPPLLTEWVCIHGLNMQCES